MRRTLRLLLLLPLLLGALAWGGFELWLRSVPPEFRAQIEQFSTLEFLGIVRDAVAPPPVPDRAGFGRRQTPGRGDAPWVRRSALDGRPRMLVAALAPSLRVAYSTESAALHQLWRGDVEYTGPVYDAVHGREPTSRGDVYWRLPARPAWQIERSDAFVLADVQWQAHGLDPETGALWLRYRLSDPQNPEAARVVTEWPEREAQRVMPAVGLERRFQLSPGPALALSVGQDRSDPSDPPSAEPLGPGLEVLSGARLESGRVRFDHDVRRARLIHRFDAPAPTIAAETSPPLADEDAFTRSDCLSCHNERERVVGPAWSEVALRYAGANRSVTERQLAGRIREGTVGNWGDVPMPAHPTLSRREAYQLARRILDTPPSEAPVRSIDDAGAEATWTFQSDTEAPPDALHPALASAPIALPGFTPQVGGLAWLPDGRLAVATWDPDGAVFAIHGWDAPGESLRVDRIAEGLHEPLGLVQHEGVLYVMQKQEITALLDHDDDGSIDEYRTIANDWEVTSNFHEFGFGLVARDNHLYATLGVCVLAGGKSCQSQTPDRGTVIRASIQTGAVERVASGFRTPNGIAKSPDGTLFVTDNQGDWLPSSKLVRVDEGATYGWHAPADLESDDVVTPPALWLPQNEVGNSPTQPLVLESGPYAGQLLFGDIYNGGLKRAVLEEVDGVLQGAAFHFSGGFQAPIHRLLATPSGGFIAGQIGSRGNWGEPGKARFGLEVVSFRDISEDPAAFEPLAVSLREDGFEITLSRPLADDLQVGPDQIGARDWFYVPAPIYGGPKYGLRTLDVRGVTLSRDRTRLRIEIPDLAPGRVVYLRLDPSLRSVDGAPLWVNETWYTLNQLVPARLDVAAPPAIAERTTAAPPEPAAPNTLSEAERVEGWRLLFDGRSFAGWKIYGADDGQIEHWTIDDDALHFTRDVSLLGLVWNHVNPFTRGAVDLMTTERFRDFELSIDWRISEGGNSGIFYAIPDESSRLSWDYALEMQVLDDAGHMDGEIERHRAGDLYDLQSLARNAARPVGEWNRARIRVDGDRVRHWLNGQLVADLVRGSAAWDAAITGSKFADQRGFGRAEEGHLSLQDHGDPVWFRNVKIREFEAAAR